MRSSKIVFLSFSCDTLLAEKGLKIDNGIKVKGQLGRVHLAQRSYEKSIAYLEEVTAQDSSPESMMQLGQAYLGAKRVSDAQSTLENVLEKSPTSQEARIILVQIYAVQGRADEAFDAVIPLVEQLLLKRDADRAANLLLQITTRSPHHVRTLQKLVEVARVRGNDRAIVQALNNLLEAHLASGSDRAAEDTASQLVEVEPDVTDAARAEYGQPPLAEVYRKVLDLNGFPNDEPTFERLQRRGLTCSPQAMTKKAQRRVAPPTP